jgi:mannitol-1-/sugar-/sorbitol-6-/2-deoxyglucose-6-phosphatase
MDGLMVDSEPLWYDVERGFARDRGGEWTPELARACTGQGMANTLAVMHRELGFAVDGERDTAVIVDTFIRRVADLALKPGFVELFADCEAGGVPRALASSSPLRLVEAVVRRFELGDRFLAIVTGDHVAHPKPRPDIFLEAARRLDVRPEDCVVLEDSMAGVRAAKAAGMRVIAVPESHAESFLDVADAVVPDLHRARARLVLESPR